MTLRTARRSSPAAEGDAVGRSLGAPVLFQLVVAELVEALDDSRGGEAFLHDPAGAVGCGGEFCVVAVDGLPVVHCVDDDLAGEQVVGELAEAVGGDGEDDDVGVADDLVGRGRVRTGCEHVDGQGDVVGRARSCDRDVVAGGDGGGASVVPNLPAPTMPRRGSSTAVSVVPATPNSSSIAAIAIVS
jgi:hypothetical protein